VTGPRLSGVHSNDISTEKASHAPTHARRCYTAAQIIALLQLPRASFYSLRRQGKLPFLEELQPRLGGRIRYKAAPVDRYLDNLWNKPRAFQRRSA
jgi:predicted DNA-binding transcriptional regulator AlpA